MKCKICGKEIIRIRLNQLYCKKCSKIVINERQKKYEREHYTPRSKLSICRKCGIEFTKNSSRQQYCSPCSKINNKEYQKTYIKQYMKTENGKLVFKKLNQKRRAKMNSIKEEFTMEEWFKKVDETKGMCPGYKYEPHFVGKNKLTLDHIIPISKAAEGFTYTIDDVQPLCRICNSRKHTK